MESALYQRACAEDIRLIETLAWDGRAFPRLELHLARLRQSASRLGFPCDLTRVRRGMFCAVGQDAARLRLTLDHRGAVAVTTAPLPDPKPIWCVGLAVQNLQSDDPWVRLKTTHRPAYDAARAALPAGLDEVILLNERGEVCDGTITTVFFDRGAGLRTPPVTSGVLPGVLRAQMACPEEVLMAGDLAHVRLWVGNSLRGLIKADLAA